MIQEKSRPQVPGPTFALALGLVAFIAPLAVHLFFPVIPAVKVALGLSEAAAQFNFSIALFAMALATLAYGSLSDRYGRRPLLLSGLLLFLLGSAVSAVAPGATALALGRIVQAVGAGCSMTLVRTIARDAYRAEYLVRAIAYLTMFYTLGPMIAPLFGGVLIDTLGWRSVFGFALIVGVFIAIAAYAWIFETRPQLSGEPGETGIMRGYAELVAQASVRWIRAAERIQYRCLHDHGERVRDADEGVAGAIIDRVRPLFPGVSRRLLFRQLAVQPDRQPPIERGDGAYGLAALDGDHISSNGAARFRHGRTVEPLSPRPLAHLLARHRLAVRPGRSHGGHPAAGRHRGGRGRLHAEHGGGRVYPGLRPLRGRHAVTDGSHSDVQRDSGSCCRCAAVFLQEKSGAQHQIEERKPRESRANGYISSATGRAAQAAASCASPSVRRYW